MNHRTAFLSLCAGFTLAACGGPPPPISPTEKDKTTAEVNAVLPPAQNPALYPAGPYGYQLGDVIPNISFMGRPDPQNAAVSARMSLSDYYQKKSEIKVVALLVAAEWCPPCQQEQGELINTWKEYQAAKAPVMLIEALTESKDGSPADLATLDRWTKGEYSGSKDHSWTDTTKNPPESGLAMNFPLAADPTYEVVPLGLSGYPTQIVVQTSDMTIQWVNVGYGKGALKDMIDSLIAP